MVIKSNIRLFKNLACLFVKCYKKTMKFSIKLILLTASIKSSSLLTELEQKKMEKELRKDSAMIPRGTSEKNTGEIRKMKNL